MTPRVLLIDNYDSFVYNLVQELGELGAEPVVHRNDAIDVAGIRSEQPDAIVISPGPGRPEDSGISLAVVEQLSGEIPILGSVPRASVHRRRPSGRGSCRPRSSCTARPRASATTDVGVFSGLPDPFVATRYHSLVVDPGSVPATLEVTATVA